MRSGLAAALMGIGWIFISFGITTVILYLLARQAGGATQWLPAMSTMMLGTLVVGAVMFGAGYLLGRVGRSSDRSTAPDRSIA